MGDVEFIVAPGQPYAGREMAETLVFELERQDMPGAVTLGPFPDLVAVAEFPPVYVIVDPRGFLAATDSGLPEPALLRRTIVVWTGAPPADGDDQLVSALSGAGAVFADTQRSVVALHRRGLKARLLRPGWTARHDRFDADAARPINALFLGVQTPRRARWLEHARPVLEGCRVEIQVAHAPPRADDVSAPLAAPRWDLLARSQILLAVHGDDDRAIDWSGALDAMHAGTVVVSEHSSALAPLVPGEQLVLGCADALPHIARALLRRPQQLAEIRGAAHERLREWIPYALWASVLRAAVVELIGEPLQAPIGPSPGVEVR